MTATMELRAVRLTAPQVVATVTQAAVTRAAATMKKPAVNSNAVTLNDVTDDTDDTAVDAVMMTRRLMLDADATDAVNDAGDAECTSKTWRLPRLSLRQWNLVNMDLEGGPGT